MAEAFDAPENFDPNNLRHLLTLIDNLRLARVKLFEHPCGLKLQLDTYAQAPAAPAPTAPMSEDDF